jgi:hypothetical protein
MMRNRPRVEVKKVRGKKSETQRINQIEMDEEKEQSVKSGVQIFIFEFCSCLKIQLVVS